MSRSYLFVPGDSERKLAKAAESDADALILDLEDAVTPGNRRAARQRVAEFLANGHDIETWVRINPLDTTDALEDLRIAVPAAPRGVVLPKPRGAHDANQLAKLLDALETEHGLSPGQTRILPIATERPGALFRMHDYAEATPRIEALTWGAEDLAAAIGAYANRDAGGQWLPTFELARSLCLLAAAAGGVAAIDTVYTDFRDSDGLAQSAAGARRDGFSGKLAIHPDQVAVINAAFRPTPEEVERAQAIIEAFEKDPQAGAVSIDGKMVDRPHWLQARRILDAAKRDES